MLWIWLVPDIAPAMVEGAVWGLPAISVTVSVISENIGSIYSYRTVIRVTAEVLPFTWFTSAANGWLTLQ